MSSAAAERAGGGGGGGENDEDPPASLAAPARTAAGPPEAAARAWSLRSSPGAPKALEGIPGGGGGAAAEVANAEWAKSVDDGALPASEAEAQATDGGGVRRNAVRDSSPPTRGPCRRPRR